MDLETPDRILLSGRLGAPGDLDGHALVLEVAAVGERGVLQVAGGRRIELWFDEGHPTYGRADGLVGLDGRLGEYLTAERFAAAEQRARASGGLAAQLSDAGVPPRPLREGLQGLVLDVLRLLIAAAGDYRFEAGPHPYSGGPWIDTRRLLDVVHPRSSVGPARPVSRRSRAGAPAPTPAAPAGPRPLVAQSMPDDVVGVRLDANLWVVALALAEPRTVDEVADRTGLSVVAVTEAVHRLERAGLVADALAGLRDGPDVAPRHPITGRRHRETTLVLGAGREELTVRVGDH